MLPLALTVALFGAQPEPTPMRAVRDAMTLAPGATCLERDRLASVVVSTLRVPEVDARIEVDIHGDPDDPLKVAYTVRRRGEVIALRRFEPGPADCAQLHVVVGVSVALAIDATAVPPPEPEPIPPTPLPHTTVPEVATDEERAPRIDAEPRRSNAPRQAAWALRLGLGGGFSLNAPPRVGGYGDLALEAGWKDYLDLRASVLASSSAPRDTPVGRATLSLAGARADICGGYRWRMLRPRACVGAVGGAAFGTGQGFIDDRTSRVPWFAVTFGADLRVRVARRLEIELGADGVAHAVRPAFDFIDPNGVRRAVQEFPGVGVLIGAGLVLTLTN